jgi:gluconokinase
MSTQECTEPAMLVVVMGVSGSGKTTLAIEIARYFNMRFLDADGFHSEAAIKQMSKGIALSDAQRAPWIQRICRRLREMNAMGTGCVLAYSGLRKAHRQAIFGAYNKVVGVMLNADQTLIEQRLRGRSEHFMPAKLLNSQIASMEPFDEDRPCITLNAAEQPDALLLHCVDFIETLSCS